MFLLFARVELGIEEIYCHFRHGKGVPGVEEAQIGLERDLSNF